MLKTNLSLNESCLILWLDRTAHIVTTWIQVFSSTNLLLVKLFKCYLPEKHYFKDRKKLISSPKNYVSSLDIDWWLLLSLIDFFVSKIVFTSSRCQDRCWAFPRVGVINMDIPAKNIIYGRLLSILWIQVSRGTKPFARCCCPKIKLVYVGYSELVLSKNVR